MKNDTSKRTGKVGKFEFSMIQTTVLNKDGSSTPQPAKLLIPATEKQARDYIEKTLATSLIRKNISVRYDGKSFETDKYKGKKMQGSYALMNFSSPVDVVLRQTDTQATINFKNL
jgi:hypothetical protein